MKKLYFLLLSLLVLSACDKENEGPDLSYPAAFELKTLENTTPVRMYTSRGEVKDAALIKTFVTKWGSWYHLVDKKVEATTSEKITFLSGAEAALDNGRKYDLKRNGEDWVLTSQEVYTALSNPSEEHFIYLGAGISKYKPVVFDKQPLAPSAGMPSSQYKFKDQYITSLKGDALQAHRLVYTLRSGESNNYFVRSTSTSNRFDAAGLALLRSTDTLLVQEFVVVGELVP